MATEDMLNNKRPPKGGTRFPQDSLESVSKYIKGLCDKTFQKPIDIAQLNSGVFGLGASSIAGKIRSSSMKQYGLIEGGYSGFTASQLSKDINIATDDEEKAQYYTKAFMNVKIFKKTFETFQNSTVDKSKISKFAVNPMGIHPDKSKLFSDMFIESAKISGLCTVSGDLVTFKIAPYVEKEEQDGEEGLLSEESSFDEEEALDNNEIDEELSNPEPMSYSPQKNNRPNLEIKIDPSLDPEKLEKQLQVLKKYGLIK